MNKQLKYENVKYGMLVEVLHEDGSYHSGCKVHFFNRKGVLVGNYYKFLPYEKLRIREGNDRQYPRYFMGKNYLKNNIPFGERLKQWLFQQALFVTGWLLRITQPKMD
jgi:hypothetical protein